MGVMCTRNIRFLRKGPQGDKGEQGAALRGPQAWSDCAVGYAFKQGAEGEAFLDVVMYNDQYYICKKSHTKTASNYPGSSTSESQHLWQLGDKIDLVATKILLASYALIKNLGAEAIEMRDGNGNLLFEAKNGTVTCKVGNFENVTVKGKLTGSVRNPFVAAGDSFDTDYSDNVSMLSQGGSWLHAYSIPWDVNQSGRKITIVNSFWNGQSASGQASISAPSGKYFYENGVQKNELKLSNEFVELIGFGTTSTFYGWIVIARNYVKPVYKYGRTMRTLATGRVTGSTSSASIDATAFDGSTLTVTRQATGKYKVTFPSTWYAQASHVIVMLTGVGRASGSTSEACIKATLIERTTSYFIVETSDDATNNDGTFDFVLMNANDW